MRGEQVYMVEASVRLNFEHMMDLYKSGYTRIPVYDRDPQLIIGILYTKDLILVDPGAARVCSLSRMHALRRWVMRCLCFWQAAHARVFGAVAVQALHMAWVCEPLSRLTWLLRR